MKKVIAGALAATLVLAATGSMMAHHSLARFDTATPIRVTGVIAHVAWVSPHSILYVDEKRTDGTMLRWAVEGPAAWQLDRRGISKDVFRVGDEIEVCGYALRNEGSDLPRAASAEPIKSKGTDSTIVSDRVLAAEDMVLWDGKKRSWGDYGHHKCHSADDKNIHPVSPLSSFPTPDFPRRPQE